MTKSHYYIIETDDCVHVVSDEDVKPRIQMGWKIVSQFTDKDLWEVSSFANEYARQKSKTCLIANSPEEEQDWKILLSVFNLLAERGRRSRLRKEAEKRLATPSENSD